MKTQDLADYLWLLISPEQAANWSEEAALDVAGHLNRMGGRTLSTLADVLAMQTDGTVVRDAIHDVLVYSIIGGVSGWYCAGKSYDAEDVALPAEVLYCDAPILSPVSGPF